MFSLYEGSLEALSRLQQLAESGGLETYLKPGHPASLLVRSKQTTRHTQDEGNTNLSDLDSAASADDRVDVAVASKPDQ